MIRSALLLSACSLLAGCQTAQSPPVESRKPNLVIVVNVGGMVVVKSGWLSMIRGSAGDAEQDLQPEGTLELPVVP